MVWSVAFSRDGKRLASAGDDDTVRVWDTSSGRELLTLKGHAGEVLDAAFSADGKWLVAAGSDGTVRIWEASSAPPEVRHRRALVSEVQSLFASLMLREDVIATLRKDAALNEADREFAIQVAQTHAEDTNLLNDAAWNVVKVRDAGKDACARALRWAEAGVRSAPHDKNLLNTLGVAQYRVGRYADAVATLIRSEKLNATKEGSHPADLAFLAMSQHRLGQTEEARAILGRLRAVMQQRRWATDAKAQSFRREAEELLEGKASDKKP